jgi:hypothetical protein
MALRAQESAMVRQWLSRDTDIVAGDFNQTVDSALYQRDWAAYRNAFSEVALGFGYTKFTTWFGARIDHVLTAPRVEPLTCRVASDIGSDHRPVVAVVRIPPPPSLRQIASAHSTNRCLTSGAVMKVAFSVGACQHDAGAAVILR